MNTNKRKTQEEFLKECVNLYGDEYDFSKVNYINCHTKIIIICKIHGEVEVYPIKFLKGRGCPICNKHKPKCVKKPTTEEWIEKARKVHGDKYDYSKVVYNNAKEKVCIICPIHGEFWQTPNEHLNGSGCQKCWQEEFSKTNEEFLKQVIDKFGEKYLCDETRYVNSNTKVKFLCEKHGFFEQLPKTFLEGFGCPKCKYESFLMSQEEFLTRSGEVHNNKYDYRNVTYNGAFNKVEIICHKKDSNGLEHGSFFQSPAHHLQGSGCPKCSKKWKLEEDIRFLLYQNGIEFKCNDRKILGGLELDLFLPKYNVAIECQGIQHFKPIDFNSQGKEWAEANFKVVLEHDERKRKMCKEKGIKLLYYSNLGIDYPYNVFENKEELLKEITQ